MSGDPLGDVDHSGEGEPGAEFPRHQGRVTASLPWLAVGGRGVGLAAGPARLGRRFSPHPSGDSREIERARRAKHFARALGPARRAQREMGIGHHTKLCLWPDPANRCGELRRVQRARLQRPRQGEAARERKQRIEDGVEVFPGRDREYKVNAGRRRNRFEHLCQRVRRRGGVRGIDENPRVPRQQLAPPRERDVTKRALTQMRELVEPDPEHLLHCDERERRVRRVVLAQHGEFKEKRFAAGASRENMAACSNLGLELSDFLMLVHSGMMTIADELGL